MPFNLSRLTTRIECSELDTLVRILALFASRIKPLGPMLARGCLTLAQIRSNCPICHPQPALANLHRHACGPLAGNFRRVRAARHCSFPAADDNLRTAPDPGRKGNRAQLFQIRESERLRPHVCLFQFRPQFHGWICNGALSPTVLSRAYGVSPGKAGVRFGLILLVTNIAGGLPFSSRPGRLAADRGNDRPTTTGDGAARHSGSAAGTDISGALRLRLARAIRSEAR